MNKILQKNCVKHNLTEHTLTSEGRYRCVQCLRGYVAVAGRKRKKLLVEYKGGKCEECGFIGHPACYDFHHLNPKEKEFGLGKFPTISLERAKKEVDKCSMLCANCHRTKHVGIDMKIYETLKVGDVFYENVYGKSIKYVVTLATKIKTIDVLSKERRQFEWTGITESGEYQGFLVTEGLEHYGPKIHGKDELI